jgi:hypothetical protein
MILRLSKTSCLLPDHIFNCPPVPDPRDYFSPEDNPTPEARHIVFSLRVDQQSCVQSFTLSTTAPALPRHHTVLYVIILSAALDLVPPSTPKGIIAFCNIAPSLCVKATWPYLLKGRVRYVRRLTGCCILSVLGMVVRVPCPSQRRSYHPFWSGGIAF